MIKQLQMIGLLFKIGKQQRIEKAINKQKSKKYNRKVTSKSSSIVKPIEVKEVKASIEKIEESVEIIEEVKSVHEEIEDTVEIVVDDKSMQEDIEETHRGNYSGS